MNYFIFTSARKCNTPVSLITFSVGQLNFYSVHEILIQTKCTSTACKNRGDLQSVNKCSGDNVHKLGHLDLDQLLKEVIQNVRDEQKVSDKYRQIRTCWHTLAKAAARILRPGFSKI